MKLKQFTSPFTFSFLLLSHLLIDFNCHSSWAQKQNIKTNETVLSLNAPLVDPVTTKWPKSVALPRNWRTTEGQFKLSLLPPPPELPTSKGLEKVKASGSGEFSKSQLAKILKVLSGKKIALIDLRQEPHGFINGDTAVSWYSKDNSMNSSKTLEEIEKDEQNRLEFLLKEKKATLLQWRKRSLSPIQVPVKIQSVATERKLSTDLRVPYFRIPVPDYHRPRDQDVDQFIKLMKDLTPDTWIHFHCAAGIGRTTTFMVMLDMMRNAPRVSAKEIIQRQYLLGGSDLKNLPLASSRKLPWAKDRLEFIESFYKYVTAQAPEYTIPWSEWAHSVKGPH